MFRYFLEGKHIIGLNHDMSPGLGGEQNEHLACLIVNPAQMVTDSAVSAFDNMVMYVNEVVKVNLSWYLYIVWCGNCLVPTITLHLYHLPLGMIPDCRPVQVGTSERRILCKGH